MLFGRAGTLFSVSKFQLGFSASGFSHTRPPPSVPAHRKWRPSRRDSQRLITVLFGSPSRIVYVVSSPLLILTNPPFSVPIQSVRRPASSLVSKAQWSWFVGRPLVVVMESQRSPVRRHNPSLPEMSHNTRCPSESLVSRIWRMFMCRANGGMGARLQRPCWNCARPSRWVPA